jgi:hypothetical protein
MASPSAHMRSRTHTKQAPNTKSKISSYNSGNWLLRIKIKKLLLEVGFQGEQGGESAA